MSVLIRLDGLSKYAVMPLSPVANSPKSLFFATSIKPFPSSALFLEYLKITSALFPMSADPLILLAVSSAFLFFRSCSCGLIFLVSSVQAVFLNQR